MSDVLWIALRTLRVTGTSIVLATVIGVPIGAWLGTRRRRGRVGVAAIVNAGMGLPPVIAGLTIAWLVGRRGPLGLDWGCSIQGMVAAQTLIALPVVSGLVMAALLGLPQETRLQVRALGANGFRLSWTMLGEVRAGVLAALMAGYGAVVSEVGAAQMTGCNLAGTGDDTRLLTTAMVEEVRKGRFGTAALLGMLLFGIVVVIFVVVTWAQGRGVRREAGTGA